MDTTYIYETMNLYRFSELLYSKFMLYKAGWNKFCVSCFPTNPYKQGRPTKKKFF